MRSVCVVKDCEGLVVGRGWCRMHYMRWRRWGNPEEPDHRSMRPKAKCSAPDCDKDARTRGLCPMHKERERRSADPNVGPFERQCSHCGETFMSRYQTRATFCSRQCKDRGRDPERNRLSSLRSYYQKRYGLTLDQVAEMRLAGCQICGRTEAPGRWDNNLHVDHDHETGEVRGILCHGCNLALGHLSSVELLESAVRYLAH